MSWRDRLQWASQGKGKASFRGASFFIESSEIGVGRQIEMHGIFQDKKEGGTTEIDSLMGVSGNTKKGKKNIGGIYAEDLGPDADEFIVIGYVVQNTENGLDHFPERDALISALKTWGPGELVHPSYGKIKVSLSEKARITESFKNDLGIARFEMTFVQYFKSIFKTQTPDYKQKIDTSVLGTVNAALDGFTDKMRTAGAFLNTLVNPMINTISKIQTAVASVQGALASTINAALSTISSILNLADTLLDAPCDLANQLIAAGQAAQSLVGMAGEVVSGGIVGGCSGETRGDIITMSGDNVSENLGISICKNLTEAAQYDTDDLEGVPVEQQNNLSLIATISQVGMITTAAQIAIRILFSNQEDMEKVLKYITDAMDYLLLRLGSVNGEIDDPLLFQKLSQLRSDFIFSMYKKNTDLAKQIDYTVPSGIKSTLVLAYEQYGDIEREEEVFQRNKEIIKHPGFLPGGEILRVLSE
jgi:prophage DNA circulation protein